MNIGLTNRRLLTAWTWGRASAPTRCENYAGPHHSQSLASSDESRGAPLTSSQKRFGAPFSSSDEPRRTA